MSGAISEALILMIVAAILGGIIVWLLMRSRYDLLKGAHDDLEKRYADLDHRFNVQANGLKDLQGQHDALEAQLKACSSKRADLEAQLTHLKPYQSKFEQLEKDHAALKGAAANVAAQQPVVSHPDLSGKVSELEAEIARLKGRLATATAATATVQAAPNVSKGKESEADILARIKEKAGEINFGRIGVASADEKDPLQRVKGIGPFIEKKLNNIGIYTFRQIAAFTPEDETKVNEVIEFFPGRIKRDRWSAQAADFEAEKKN